MLLTGSEFIVLSFPFGKPKPIFVLRVGFLWQADTIGKEDKCRTLGQLFERLLFCADSHRVHERQSQRHARAPEKCSSLQMPGFVCHGCHLVEGRAVQRISHRSW